MKGADTMSSVGDVINMLTSTFGSIVGWVPIQAAAGFAIVGAGTAAVKKIIGIRRRGGRRK